MPKSREQKKQALEKTKENLENANSVVFTDYTGLEVNNINELRAKLKEAGAKMVVTKNTLLKKVNKDLDIKGPTAVVYGFEGVVEPVKALYEFIKNHELPQVKMGILNGQIVSAEKVQQLSELPSVDELRAKLVGSLNAPISNFVGVNREVYSSFVRVLNSYSKTKE